MNKYVFLLFLAAVAVSAQNPPAKPADGKAPAPVKLLPPRVRTGSVIKAEFTTQKPKVEKESPVAGKSSPAWAVLTLQLDPGRAASIFDYVLRKDGTEYPCLDLTEGDKEFKGEIRISVLNLTDSKKCRLIFAIPSAEDEYEIVFKLFDERGTPVKLNVKPPLPPEKKDEEKKSDDAKKAENAAAK